MKFLSIVFLFAATLSAQTSGDHAAAPSAQTDVFAMARSASAVVLLADSDERRPIVSTGVVISSDGVLLAPVAASPLGKKAQVRLADGEIYDNVTLLGYDERRGVAAMKIAGNHLPSIEAAKDLPTDGIDIASILCADGVKCREANGKLIGMRLANEIADAGEGYRVLSFATEAPTGNGLLLNGGGKLLGLVTGRGASNYAVPIDSIIGLPSIALNKRLAPGVNLALTGDAAVAQSQQVTMRDPLQLAQAAQTLNIISDTQFISADTVDRALRNQKEWPQLKLAIVAGYNTGDLTLKCGHVLFTYVHTFTLVDNRTKTVLASGKATAFDGNLASGGIAKQVVKFLSDAR